MRNKKFERLMAGTMLAAIVAMPGIASAAPERVESARPLPPSFNGQPIRHREAAPVPPPSAQPMQQPYSAPEPRVEPQAAPAAVEPRVQAPIEPRETTQTSVRGLDKVFAASDSQIIDRLRDIVAKKQLGQRVPGDAERKAVETYYASRNYAPIWIRDGQLTNSAKSAITRMKNADVDGLDPADYATPEFNGGADALAEADIKLTNTVLTYGRHLAVGRIAPRRVLAEVDYGNHTPDPADILRKVAESRDVEASLDSYNPPHDGFRALKVKLAELRRSAGREDNRIPESGMIKPGDKDARVPVLREKLGVVGKPGDLAYDKTLYNAIKNVQARADIKPTGVIDSRTIAYINGPKPGQQIERVTANMERWRWLPRDLGRTYVMVNIPDYTLKVVRDNGVVWRTKIVAGKPQTPTPLTTAPMDHIIVNPSWYVPQSIIQNELLPQYASDPQIFDRMGLEVKKGPDGNINVVQPPGAANALGRIKFAFPNKFQVYLHDTPEKKLFAHEKRAFSHGCMRVENPEKYAEVLLSLSQPEDNYTIARIRSLYGDQERTINLKKPIPVHVTYQTAFVDKQGQLNVRHDIYGLDTATLKLMRNDERMIADTPIARPHNTSSKPVMARLPQREDREWQSQDRYRDQYRGGEWFGFGGGERAYASSPPRSRSPYRGFDRADGIW